MDYLQRYRQGEYEQVWQELQSLGPAVRQEPNFTQANQVAVETMQRVRRNCEKIVARLKSAGYKFGVYADGSGGYVAEGALVGPSKDSLADAAELEEQFGPLPLTLKAFWQVVGSVDWVGRYQGWPMGRDPLVIYPPAAALSELGMGEFEEEADQIEIILAPDDLHKDNVSGGDPYAMAAPNSSADGQFLNERHHLLFVPYLRLAILKYGGFPGLDGQQVSLDFIKPLTADLEPF